MPSTHKWPPPSKTQRALIAARDLYASAPSHVAYPQIPGLGLDRHCLVTACMATVDGDLAKCALYKAANTDSLVDFNAEHTTEEVLAVFDRAIEAAGAAFSARVEAAGAA